MCVATISTGVFSQEQND